MAQEVTLGGDRLGSGNKQKVELHNYQMNSFNLEQDFKSSMAPGVLYPFLKLVGTNHDTFDIDLDSFVRTLPTKGPLFGSFKLQCDIFSVPIRLYQGILHNNPIGIGLKMNQVYLPKLFIRTLPGVSAKGSNFYNQQVNENALLKYLGLSGIGLPDATKPVPLLQRKINAVPALAYYDIFKCYYSNKQEEKAYVITPGNTSVVDNVVERVWIWGRLNPSVPEGLPAGQIMGWVELAPGETILLEKNKACNIKFQTTIPIQDKNNDLIQVIDNIGRINEYSYNNSLGYWSQYGFTITENENIYEMNIPAEAANEIITNDEETATSATLSFILEEETSMETANIILQSFDLDNIDKMRNYLLSQNTLGQEVLLTGNDGDSDEAFYPYCALTSWTEERLTWNAFQLNGLCIKTYQSDLFNNWLNTEWIDGENGIAAITAVSTDGGAFTIDSLNFAEKYYEVLNRIAVSGGTYEDWQEAVWGEGAVRKSETPMYMGGMAAEVMFEEVISTAETNVDQDFQALGSLGGKGTQVGKKGGNNIHIKCDEPCYIIGIVSLTPRICYSQGNDWDLTEINTLDDLHKPGMDGIGFQDLLVEQFAWWDHKMSAETGYIGHFRNSAGKQTAWINYQTAVDKCFGDFAKPEGYGFMVLNRNYEVDTTDNSVKDVTTYIDPTKYNYAFAYQDLAAQNFWVQIHSKVVARRKMGAQQIPNL